MTRIVPKQGHLGSGIMLAGETFWIADAHRDDGKRYVVRADAKLTAFPECESAICVWNWRFGSAEPQKTV
jgi:hypothetical protein